MGRKCIKRCKESQALNLTSRQTLEVLLNADLLVELSARRCIVVCVSIESEMRLLSEHRTSSHLRLYRCLGSRAACCMCRVVMILYITDVFQTKTAAMCLSR